MFTLNGRFFYFLYILHATQLICGATQTQSTASTSGFFATTYNKLINYINAPEPTVKNVTTETPTTQTGYLAAAYNRIANITKPLTGTINKGIENSVAGLTALKNYALSYISPQQKTESPTTLPQKPQPLTALPTIDSYLPQSTAKPAPPLYTPTPIETTSLIPQSESTNAQVLPKQLASKEGNLSLYKQLLAKKADLNEAAQHGVSPLNLAIQKGNAEAVKLLLQTGADINAADALGNTPLHYAIQNRQSEIAKYLIENGANVDKPNNAGTSPLAQATEQNQTELINRMSEKKAARNAIARMRNTKLQITAQRKQPPTPETPQPEKINSKPQEPTSQNDTDTQHKNKKNTPVETGDPKADLIAAIKADAYEKVEKLLSGGLDLNYDDPKNLPPLHIAASYGYTKIANILLEKKADINKSDSAGQTPLHHAAKNDHIEIAELLLNKKADINAGDKSGLTPLHHAAINNNIGIIKLLIEKGADINKLDNMHNTPLHYAAQNNHTKAVTLLLDAHAKRDSFNNHNKTPLDLAIKKDHTAVIKLLQPTDG